MGESFEKRLAKIKRVMAATLDCTQDYLHSEFGLNVTPQAPRAGDLEALELRGTTAVIGINGMIDLYVAFSFDMALLQRLYEQMTEGMEIGAEEAEEMKNATAGEIMNVVVGHCTLDLQDLDSEIINISPPNVMNLVKTVPRIKGAVFHLRSMATEHGAIDVYLIGPKALFSENLDYLN